LPADEQNIDNFSQDNSDQLHLGYEEWLQEITELGMMSFECFKHLKSLINLFFNGNME
jgi:hypothetical protein